jgi:hypothetical protein
MNRNYAMLMMLSGLVAAASVTLADDDDRSSRSRGPDVAPVTDALYAQECGSCHMAYPPGLLPARSWQRLMDSLADHFGDNAELPQQDAAAISRYLAGNAADRSNYPRSMRIAASLSPAEAPLRITEIPYLAHEHNEIPPRLIVGNPKVISLSQCQACHTQAEAGSFREREIYIPGYGPLDDD